ncbi:hypothetical protein FDECE_14335 [Fusarium decemcellulare]|nr:hypothetical protein FDECE_14335 [Fusarium decemcellulare]
MHVTIETVEPPHVVYPGLGDLIGALARPVFNVAVEVGSVYRTPDVAVTIRVELAGVCCAPIGGIAGLSSSAREATGSQHILERLDRRGTQRALQTRRRLVRHINARVSPSQASRREAWQSVRVADIDKPRPTGDATYPMIQLRSGENGSAAVWKVAFDGVGGEPGAETGQLSQPLVVGADDPEVRRATQASTFGHGPQPSGLILLSDALRHRYQILGIHPAVKVF